MSRYVIWIDDENIEVFVGFEEGLGTFFLTVADARTCTGEAGTYLFHNYDHHPGMLMKLEDVVTTLERFGIVAPPALLQQLIEDARRSGVSVTLQRSPASVDVIVSAAAPHSRAEQPLRVLSWQSAL